MKALQACALSLLLAGPAGAAEVLRLVANYWPPFNDRTMPGNGIATELVVEALTRAGYHTHYSEVPWARALRGLEQGEYDVLINSWYSASRESYGLYSEPYMINRLRFLQRKDAAIPYAELEDLYPYRIAVMQGYAYGPEFDADPRLNKFAVSGFPSAVRMLMARRVDAFLEDEYVIRYFLQRERQEIREQVEFVPKPLSENGLYLLIRLSHPDHQGIAAAFAREMAAMRADGSYAAILGVHGLCNGRIGLRLSECERAASGP